MAGANIGRTPGADSWLNAKSELEIEVTQKAWAKYTGKTPAEVVQWVIDTVLPDLSVFLVWRDAMETSLNQSPSRDEVKATMQTDFAVISREPENSVATSVHTTLGSTHNGGDIHCLLADHTELCSQQVYSKRGG